MSIQLCLLRRRSNVTLQDEFVEALDLVVSDLDEDACETSLEIKVVALCGSDKDASKRHAMHPCVGHLRAARFETGNGPAQAGRLLMVHDD